MSRVQFYHNTPDPIALACELIARAHAGGRRIALRLPDGDSLRRADQMLWSFEQQSFIPHVANNHPLAPETPVVLADARTPSAWPHHDLLFNLAPELPAEPESFRMVIEIIGQQESERQPARARWMEYKRRGFELKAFDSMLRRPM